MSIANPTTYGEWWWQQQVDANKTFADAEESAIAPHLQALLSMVMDLEEFPAALSSMFNAVGTPGHFGLNEIAKESLAQSGSASVTAGLSPFLRSLGYAANKKFPSARIPIDAAITLAHRGKIIPELYAERCKANGFEEAEARMMYDLACPYPDIQSLLLWARYTTNDTDTFTKLQSKMDIPDEEFQIWEFLSRIRLTAGELQGLVARGYMNEQDAFMELIRDGYNREDAQAVLDLGWSVPNANILLQDALFRNQSWETLGETIGYAGIHPEYRDAYINAVLAKPDPAEMIRYMLRHDPNLSNLPDELRRLGIHPDYLDVFRELSYPVPPIGDVITMAVREAFSPAIAGRFGQYDDYPSDLTRYAAMNGISEEWAQRYWAAHWSLPSPQQGYEMFHRGIITREELVLLMRALDIMPFWRDKLIEMAYRPLTRVDVRRMYTIGVLTETEVEKAYRDVGYSDENARRLRDFVVKNTLQSQSGLTVGKIVTAYKNGYTDRSGAYNAVLDLGIKPQQASDIMERADLQLQWQAKKDAIAAVQAQYKEEIIDESEARSQLSGLRLPNDKVNNLITRWTKDGIAEKKTLWTKADTLSLLASGIITSSRATQELTLLGYNNERASALIKKATSTE